ncbi:CELL DIVISION CYCLE 7-RELATED PROTEIN KINASE [Salix purpurea]|uniref:non-specific serine/threonine protein kinase n=2 Tax=Salix purpurea TaxID=77065 RepID=A0A9Q0T9M3_SALPP|nr:CELL DIVISION CYCLE 7-RELATED PROTEIN KINASE [Salix purpurea]
MQNHSSSTQLALIDSLTTATNSTESDLQEKAWHILGALLSIGNPTPALELASHCTLFNASPDLIESLCSIPNSPITLTFNSDNCSNSFLVTISPLGLFALNQFVSNFILNDALANPIRAAICRPRVPFEDVVRMYFKKRKRIGCDSADVYEKEQGVCTLSKRNRNGCETLTYHLTEDVNRINVEPTYMPIQPNNLILAPDFVVKTIVGELSCKVRDIEHVEGERNTKAIVESGEDKRIMACEIDEESALPIVWSDNEAVVQEAKVNEIDLESRADVNATCCLDDVKWSSRLLLEFTSVNGACNAINDCCVETVGTETKEELVIDHGKTGGEGANQFQQSNTAFDMPQERNFRRNELNSLDKETISTNMKNQAEVSSSELCVPMKLSKVPKPSNKIKVTTGAAVSPKQQTLCQSLEHRQAVNSPKENQQRKKDQMKISMAQKSKQACNDIRTKERKQDCALSAPKDEVSKDFPRFDSYIVEKEEGSGGYGTVYKATRKHDGTTVAIKCPHENAHRHHVINELRMLERFGGKNFVIKYEGCLKNQNSDCLVLAYVEHDRPEVLKREIDVFQLRWYGYCMFRALGTLHKQGVVHRDVKPGNFLFSCKASKGYLIDFNLALDLHQKLGAINKSKAANDVSFNNVAVSNAKYIPPSKSRRFPGTKFLDAVDVGAIKGWDSTLEAKNVKRKPVRNIMKSQGADGSGITSVKDATSARTPSAERLREPLPCLGRKELISLLHETMQSPNHEASSVPASMRKRIAAPPRKADGRHIYLTPMPLHSTDIAAAGIGLAKNKGDGKNKKEGPCVGTKGFRAPEVLFRSLHQGPKVDIWSAGVTLLYLIIGKTPFYGDPEQNIKDIAKLRGSEDLWEISKLHDRESSFPVDLYNMQSLPPTTLWKWCKVNSKRQDFLDAVPSSLIDLVDKCLTVNPRLRISAEDALKHEFFAPCHESLRKQKLLRQGHCLDSRTNIPSHGQSIA